MDLEGIMLSEISQTDKDKYSLWNLMKIKQSSEYNNNNNKQTNKKKNRLTDIKNKLVVSTGKK